MLREERKWNHIKCSIKTREALQSKGALTVEDYWTECQYYDIV